jgi:hypothetical protein
MSRFQGSFKAGLNGNRSETPGSSVNDNEPIRTGNPNLLYRISFSLLEARVRIELTNKGFADLCLTTWLPRLKREALGRARLDSSRTIPRNGWRSQILARAFRDHRQ